MVLKVSPSLSTTSNALQFPQKPGNFITYLLLAEFFFAQFLHQYYDGSMKVMSSIEKQPAAALGFVSSQAGLAHLAWRLATCAN